MSAYKEDKPLVVWVDDSVAHERSIYEWAMRRVEEEAGNHFEIVLFESSDEAIPFVIDNASRVFMFVQDSTRLPGKVIPAWRKLRTCPGPAIGYDLHQGDFYTYVIDAFAPEAGAIFSGFSYSTEDEDLIRTWGARDQRITLASKWDFLNSREFDKISPFARTASEQLTRWLCLRKDRSVPSDQSIVRPLAEEMAVLCGVRPDRLDKLTPRQFEELIASLFKNHGFEVELTSATRDGGYDIVAASHTGLTTETALIEVKHFAPHRPVGVGIVRALYGVRALNKVPKAILVTSSYVSQYAHKEFSRVIPWEIEFVERKELLDWCQRYVADILEEEATDTEQEDPADKQ